MVSEYHFEWPDETATQAWAHTLSQQPGLGLSTIELQGDLGAGKTTLVRHLLRALGVQGRIKSPTYALVEMHHAAPTTLWPHGFAIQHFDLYRLGDPRELEEAGLRELLSEPGLKLVEWPDKAGPHRPGADLRISLQPQADERRVVTVQALTARGLALLQPWEP
jgi:tRNA threonylcarbamoyladenosine biosynthesis protein TsaE